MDSRSATDRLPPGDSVSTLGGVYAMIVGAVGDDRTKKHEEGRNSLPDELKPAFDALVEDYKFAAQKHYNSTLVSYWILADLVRAGWRLAAEPERQESDS